MWALASILALRGLSLRPIVHNHPPQFPTQFSPALHIHTTLPAPSAAEVPDTHPLHKR